MYFRLGSQTNSYYDTASKIPADRGRQYPQGRAIGVLGLLSHEPDFYVEWIKRHRALGVEPLVAGGVWTWSHFWAALPFSFTATDACMRACKSQSIREVFVTLWGDDGMECDVFSALPGIQFFAEHAYADSVDEQQLRANFRGSCDAEFDDWVGPVDRFRAVPGRPGEEPHQYREMAAVAGPDARLDGTADGTCYRCAHTTRSCTVTYCGLPEKVRPISDCCFPRRLAKVLSLEIRIAARPGRRIQSRKQSGCGPWSDPT
jgi:hypothetical protein